MKLLNVAFASAFAVALMGSAFADETKTAPAAPAAEKTTAAPAAKKMSKKQAKKECKADGKKGAELKACIKEKTA